MGRGRMPRTCFHHFGSPYLFLVGHLRVAAYRNKVVAHRWGRAAASEAVGSWMLRSLDRRSSS